MTFLNKFNSTPVFSLNFCSAGKGPFIGGKAKKKCMPEAHFPGEGR